MHSTQFPFVALQIGRPPLVHWFEETHAPASVAPPASVVPAAPPAPPIPAAPPAPASGQRLGARGSGSHAAASETLPDGSSRLIWPSSQAVAKSANNQDHVPRQRSILAHSSAGRAQRTSARQRPLRHDPEQQSRLVVHAPRDCTHDVSHEPPRQNPVQQSALVLQAPAVGVQSGGGGWHVPPTQPKLQQSAFWVQADPFGTHVVRQIRWPLTTLHSPRQQSALVVQPAFCGRQVVGPKSQRSVVSLQTSQQPRPVPLVQSSPVGRQLRLGSSIAHSPRA